MSGAVAGTGELPRGRVVVAMSGGVDSAVAAGLLVEAGCEVVGVTMQLYDHGEAVGRAGSCCAGRDVRDARAVAEHLGIPHYVVDYQESFRRAVIDDFVESYARGRTPIPCVRCNERIKFGDLLEFARDLGAEALATGHYVERREGPGGPELHRATDTAKDQSYFLFTTTPDQLARLCFPLGRLTKAETRDHARRLGLPVAEKAESQDICFVPDGDHTRVVGAARPEALRPGPIAHVDGRLLGRHRGLAGVTVGQRRGLAVAGGERLYVTRIDPASGTVTMGPRQALAVREIELGSANWLTRLDDGRSVTIRHRHTPRDAAARVVGLPDGRFRVILDAPEHGVAPGQACVAYDGTRLLGGGWIEATR